MPKLPRITVRLEEDVLSKLSEKAAAENTDVAVYARNIITRFLSLDFNSQQRDALEIILRESMREEMKSVTDRIVALSAKSSIMSASAFFMLRALIQNVYSDNVDIEQLVNDCKREASLYVRNKPE